jgi:hypothetical protein
MEGWERWGRGKDGGRRKKGHCIKEWRMYVDPGWKGDMV